jgi:hypothetical protein
VQIAPDSLIELVYPVDFDQAIKLHETAQLGVSSEARGSRSCHVHGPFDLHVDQSAHTAACDPKNLTSIMTPRVRRSRDRPHLTTVSSGSAEAASGSRITQHGGVPSRYVW